MPYNDSAPTAAMRIAGRGLCLVSYLLAVLVSIGDFYVPSPTLRSVVDREWSDGLALALAFLSVVGFCAVLAHRWRVEWVPATVVAILLLQRSVPVWASLGHTPYNLSAASMMTLGALCLGKRALDLWRFSVETKATAGQASDEPG